MVLDAAEARTPEIADSKRPANPEKSSFVPILPSS